MLNRLAEKSLITSIDELLQLLKLKPMNLKNTEYPLKVPRDFANKIAKRDPNDPLLQQILPQHSELEKVKGYLTDPLKDKDHSPIYGVVRKYQSRALLLTTNNCFINCRFCFRRFCDDYIQDWQKVFDYIAADISINEIILSGGDPLALTDEKLAAIITALAAISHLKYLRIHTRAPIAYPKRITPELLSAITISRFKPIIVTHCNHPNEIDDKITDAIKLLKSADITLYNQSVLLKNVNDNAGILIMLSEKLFANNIQPYYIHMLDKVVGAQRFYVDIATAKHLLKQMQLALPGYLVPKLVYQDPDALSKTFVEP